MYPSEPIVSRDPLCTPRNKLLVRVAAPANEPLTLAEAKLYLRVDHSSEDALITDFIISARMIAESWMKTSLLTQSWKLSCNDALPVRNYLPMGPVQSITSVMLTDRDGGTATISANGYYLNAAKNELMLDSAMAGFQFDIVYVTGYGYANAVPRPIRQGMLAHIAAMYDGRGDSPTASLPAQVVALYTPYREVRV